MIDLYYWTTPNGHKITIFLESGLRMDMPLRELDRDRSSYRPRSDIHRRTYQTSCAPGRPGVEVARRGTERKFFNDFSRACMRVRLWRG
jgi:hypothetical protein